MSIRKYHDLDSYVNNNIIQIGYYKVELKKINVHLWKKSK
jgi:hypothetical protein